MKAAAALILLAGALFWGRLQGLPELESSIHRIFPEATTTEIREGIHFVYGREALLGWVGTGTGQGYGGPMTLLVGIDTLGLVAGVEVVEKRETPVFWRMVRADEYFRALKGEPFDSLSWEYVDVVGATGATLSAEGIVAGVRASVAKIAGPAFDVRMPRPRRPFEFGFLEVTILGLFGAGILAQRTRGSWRRRLRWATQLTGLLVLGFWKDSPITLAKITAFLSGYFPDPRTALAIYLLLAGFLLTSLVYGRNIYCLYACPFGAAQRVVGAIGGGKTKIPPSWIRFLEGTRNLVVFAALFAAFLTLQPALASYEPFAALFSLRGVTLQWLLLFLVLVASLAIRTPWCAFFCPMRTVEVVVQDVRGWMRRGKALHGPAGGRRDAGGMAGFRKGMSLRGVALVSLSLLVFLTIVAVLVQGFVGLG